MGGEYVLAHVDILKHEWFLLKGNNRRGNQYATYSEARGELATKLVRFTSVGEAVQFLEGDHHVDCIVRKRESLFDVPHLFRMSLECEEPAFFRLYQLDEAGIPAREPYRVLRLE